MHTHTTKPLPRERALYPGTFDPITFGHIDIIQRALLIFESVTILVSHSSKKAPLLSSETRKELILESFPSAHNVKVETYQGLLVDYAKDYGFSIIVRGLRAVSDFEYEFQMATMNRRMYPNLQTLFLMSTEQFFFVNSSLVKELVSHGGDVSELVPKHVEKKLKEKIFST